MKKQKHILIAGLLAMSSIGIGTFAVVNQNQTRVVAEEVETVSAEPEETTSKFKQIWEGYLLPAVLSINIGTIVAMITSIALAIKNYKSHKSYNQELSTLSILVVDLSKKMLEYSKEQFERNQKVQELLEAIAEAKETTKAQMALAELQNTNYEKLRDSVVGLINLEIELAKNSPEMVKSGAAKQAIDLKNQIMSVLK